MFWFFIKNKLQKSRLDTRPFLISVHFTDAGNKSDGVIWIDSVIWIVVGVAMALWQWLLPCVLYWWDSDCAWEAQRWQLHHPDRNTIRVACAGTAASTQGQPCPLNPHCVLKTSLRQARAQKYEDQNRSRNRLYLLNCGDMEKNRHVWNRTIYPAYTRSSV